MPTAPQRHVGVTGLHDVDGQGHVLVRWAPAGVHQLLEVGGGVVRLLTDFGSDVSARYLPGTRDLLIETADGRAGGAALYRFDADAVTDEDDPDEPHHDGPLVSAVELVPVSTDERAHRVLAVDNAGRTIACALDGGVPGGGIEVHDVATGASTPVRGGALASGVPLLARFCPDGTRLALTLGPERDAGGTYDLAVISVADATVLAGPLPGAGAPVCWSADSSTVVTIDGVSCDEAPGGTLWRHRIRAAGSGADSEPVLRMAAASSAAGSRDGGVLVVYGERDGTGSVRWLDTDLTELGVVDLPEGIPGTGIPAVARLTPDGTSAAVFLPGAGSVHPLWRADRADGSVHRLG